MEETNAYLRANGQMLHNMRGQQVCMLGRLNKINSDKCSFEITSCDNKTILCKLKVPIRENLSEFVEVYGDVDERANINCLNYTTFEPSLTQNFDMDLYNETVQMIYQLPKHYIQANC